MQQLIITRGIPSSGKSTYATDLVTKDPTFYRVNKDSLRLMFNNGVYSRDFENFIHAASQKLISMALSDGKNVIVDNTHIDSASVKALHKIAAQVGNIEVKEIWFRTPIEECHRRNDLRTGLARVPREAIDRMGAGIKKSGYGNCEDKTTVYPPQSAAEVLEQDESLPEAIIVDLDGTLAHIGDRSPYDATRCDVVDRPHRAVVELVLGMHHNGAKIIFMSGREAKDMEPTRRFIEKNCREFYSHPCYDDADGNPYTSIPYELFMRATGDQRKDNIVKRELFDAHVRNNYNVLFTVDDRNQVVQLWRSMGLTCFQCAEGDF